MKSLGVIETYGLTSAIQAADAACKAASVEIVGYRKIGSGLVSVCFQGEISAVRTAVDHGASVISHQDLLKGTLVIARPEERVITQLLSAKNKAGEKENSVEKNNIEKNSIEKSAVEAPVTVTIETAAVEPKADVRKGKKS